MGFKDIAYEKPHYDLGNNGYLPENIDHYEKRFEHWELYITTVVSPEQDEELLIVPTSTAKRIDQLERAYDKDKHQNSLDPAIETNSFDPNKLRINLNTGSPIVDFVLRHNITGLSHFATKDTEFDKTLDKKIGFVTDEIKSYLASTGQTSINITGKIAQAQIWRYYTRIVDNHLSDIHHMLRELQIIGLIHSGDLTFNEHTDNLREPHLSPHMLKYCKLNLSYRDFCPYADVHKNATHAAFSHHENRTGLDTPIIWTLGEFHINGIDNVLRKLDERLYGFVQSTLPKFFLDQVANNPDIKGSGVNLISFINKTFGKLNREDSDEILRQLNAWKKLSITSPPSKSLNAFHAKYLLYQDIESPGLSFKQREQTIKHAMIRLLGTDYGREPTALLSQKVQQDNNLTVAGLIEEIASLQSHYRNQSVNVTNDQGQPSREKRKNNDNRDGSKRQRNGNSSDKPTCRVCGKLHFGKCTNKEALKAFHEARNTSSDRNTSSRPKCELCGIPGHVKENCHRDPANATAKAEYLAKKQQAKIRGGNGNSKFNGYSPKNNTNKVNNIELNEHDGKDDDVNMTDVVQHITHNDQDDDLVDFDSDSD